MHPIDAVIADADVSADALIARLGAVDAPSEADLAGAGRVSALTRFTRDVNEVLEQVTVAGLAYPDPDLPDAVDALAGRGAALGVRTPVAPLLRMAACLRLCSPDADAVVRRDAGARAFEAAQRVTVWLRLFRREQSLSVVAARLAAVEGEASTRATTGPTRSVEAWPLGLSYAGGRLTILAQDRDDGTPVIIRDAVPDFDQHDPFRAPYLSRLFQAAVSLGKVLNSLLIFSDHPYAERGGAIVFAPAFRAAAQVRSVTANFEPPGLPEARPGARRPGVLTAEVRDADAGPGFWLPAHAVMLAVADAPVLTLNLLKAVTVGAQRSIQLCVIDGPQGARVLHAVIDGERCFPAADPAVFRWRPTALMQAAAKAPVWLRAAAAIHGGAAPAVLEDLRGYWPDTPSVEAAWQASWVRAALGAVPPQDAQLAPLIQLALHAAIRPGECSAAEFSRLLGKPAGALGPAERAINGRVVFMAVWLAGHGGEREVHLPMLRALFTARYTRLDTDPDLHDVCVRALLMAAFAEETALDEGSDVADGYVPILEYMQTHLSSLVRRPGGAEPQPLPPLDAVLAFADTWARLNGRDPHHLPVAQLGLDRAELGMAIARALYAWRCEGAPGRIAADALWVGVSAGLARWFVEPVGTELFDA